MTYGPAVKWRFPFQECIKLMKSKFKTLFITLCIVISFVFVLFSYYSSTSVHVNSHSQTYIIRDEQFKFVIGQNETDKDQIQRVTHRRVDENVEIFEDKLDADADTVVLKLVKATEKISEIQTTEHPELVKVVTDKVNAGEDNKDDDGKVVDDDNGYKDSVGDDEDNVEYVDDDEEDVGNGYDDGSNEDGDIVDDEIDPYEDSADYSKDVASEGPKQVDISTVRSGSHVAGFQWNDARLDILHMRKPDYDKKFKNPCWHELLESPTPYVNNTYAPFSPSAKRVLGRLTEMWDNVFKEDTPTYRLRCLPYFMIIGQPKCGTTDLFWKIAKHPDILTPPIKELHWWSRSRQGRRFSYSKIIPFEDYVDMFDQAAVSIEKRLHNITELEDADDRNDDTLTENNSQAITGEASVSLFWDNSEWTKYPENKGQTEPTYIVPHYIHHIIPHVKMILMLRDPVERMYSDYLYFHSTNKSAEDFHKAVVYAVDVYTKCLTSFGVRKCIYDTSLANKVRVRLRIGMYSAYLQDWLRLFPLKQFFFLRLEDYSRNPVVLIEQIYKFLQMRPITSKEERAILGSPVSNVRKDEDKKLGGMFEETRQILKRFYEPYNQKLTEILHDKKYLWKDV